MNGKNIRGATRAEILAAMREVALEAAQVVMRVYETDFSVEYKGEDDPVTLADRESNALITSRLMREYGWPVVAEESNRESYKNFVGAEAVFFVDPVDGTREFVSKIGEFTIMIGLAEHGEATAGVILAPAKDREVWGSVFEGAFERRGSSAAKPLSLREADDVSRARWLLSRTRSTPELEMLISMFPAAQIERVGGSGYKAMLVACGEAEAYVHPGRAGHRWDACAPDAILRSIGKRFTQTDGTVFRYDTPDIANTKGVIAGTPAVHAAIVDAFLRGRP